MGLQAHEKWLAKISFSSGPFLRPLTIDEFLTPNP